MTPTRVFQVPTTMAPVRVSRFTPSTWYVSAPFPRAKGYRGTPLPTSSPGELLANFVLLERLQGTDTGFVTISPFLGVGQRATQRGTQRAMMQT
jgi:hypothetical protein